MRIYLDNCCFNRPFDDQKQLRIRLETEAKLDIQEKILVRTFELAWSYVIDFENEANPFEQRRIAVQQWRSRALIDVTETKEVIEKAEQLTLLGIKSKDALHLACAISAECNYFLTTDDELVRKAERIKAIKVTDPISFIKEDYK